MPLTDDSHTTDAISTERVFPWTTLVTMHAALGAAPFAHTSGDGFVSVTLNAADIARLVEINGGWSDDAQDGKWAETAVSEVLVALAGVLPGIPVEELVLVAASIVAESAIELDDVARVACSTAVVFDMAPQRSFEITCNEETGF